MLSYLRCIKSHRGTNDPECRNLSKSYLSCRMDRYVHQAFLLSGYTLRLPVTHTHCETFLPLSVPEQARVKTTALIPPDYPDSLRKESHTLSFVLHVLMHLIRALLTTSVLTGISWLLIRLET